MKLLRTMTIWLLIMIAGFLVSTPGVYADNINLGDLITFSRGPGSGPGGEFIVTDTTTGYQFSSFCVETNEYISFGSQFSVGGISSQAINGGSGGGHPDPLDYRTAYLYYHFVKRDLSNYNYGSNASADALQKAIWYVEQELGNTDWSNPAAYLGTGTQALAWFNEASAANWTDYNGVAILNVLNSAGAVAQDQLVLVPEPSTLLLLGFGLLGLGILGRKKFKAKA